MPGVGSGGTRSHPRADSDTDFRLASCNSPNCMNKRLPDAIITPTTKMRVTRHGKSLCPQVAPSTPLVPKAWRGTGPSSQRVQPSQLQQLESHEHRICQMQYHIDAPQTITAASARLVGVGPGSPPTKRRPRRATRKARAALCTLPAGRPGCAPRARAVCHPAGPTGWGRGRE